MDIQHLKIIADQYNSSAKLIAQLGLPLSSIDQAADTINLTKTQSFNR